jgi:uncharacterized membrane protein
MATNKTQQIHRSSEIARSLKARANAKRTLFERFADSMTAFFGSIYFLLANVVWFMVWIIINLNLIPGIPAFDPFPFGLLTMIVSLEAIVLAIVVLISQNREARIAELREEVDLQIDIITEQEITKISQLLILLLEKEKVKYPKDPELEITLQPTDAEKMEKLIEEEVK